MIRPLTLRWQIAAFAAFLLICSSPPGVCCAGQDRNIELQQPDTTPEVSADVGRMGDWSLSSSATQRGVSVAPAYGVVPCDVCVVTSLQLGSQLESLIRSRDSRHRIQRLERILLLI